MKTYPGVEFRAALRAALTMEDLNILHSPVPPRGYVLRQSKQRTYSDLAMDADLMDSLTHLEGVSPAVRLTLLELGALS